MTGVQTCALPIYFGEKLFNTVIPRNIKLSEAPSHGKPVLLYDIESKGARSYLEATKEIIERNLPRATLERLQAGMAVQSGSVAEAARLVMTPDFVALVSGMVNYWFMDRTLAKRGLA